MKMFVCGPTVYDYIHIGNARTFVFFDVVAKWLRHTGVELEYIQNITDIDDKIIARAKEQSREPAEYAREWEQKFYEDAKAVGITSPQYKRAMDHVPEIRSQVERLMKSGHAYTLEDGIYFDLSAFADYGKLSGRTDLKDDDAVSRIDENEQKRNKGDFCIWKGTLEDGRPGWHIEDTAITEKYFGPQYDLHGGGADLMFPHHEAEIAIMESVSGLKPFVKQWMHVAFLVNKSAKMSKSLGNFATLHDLLQQYTPEAIRFYLLSAHYKTPLDFSDASLKNAEAATMRMAEFLTKLDQFEDEMPSQHNEVMATIIKRAKEDFEAAMREDYNTPKAFGVIFELIKTLNPYIQSRRLDQDGAHAAKELMKTVHTILGVVPSENIKIPRTLDMLIEQRERARQSKDFNTSDRLRSQIEAAGYKIDDTAYGPLVKKK